MSAFKSFILLFTAFVCVLSAPNAEGCIRCPGVGEGGVGGTLFARRPPEPTNRPRQHSGLRGASYGEVADLPENWDQTKDDTQSLFLNKNDKNDLEPYPLAVSEEGSPTDDISDRVYDSDVGAPGMAGLTDEAMMRPELFGEPPALAMYGTLSRRKRAQRSQRDHRTGRDVATHAGRAGHTSAHSGVDQHLAHGHRAGNNQHAGHVQHTGQEQPLEQEEHVDHSGHDDHSGHEHDQHIQRKQPVKRSQKNLYLTGMRGHSSSLSKTVIPESRIKRDSGMSSADLLTLLSIWEAQERKKTADQNARMRWGPESYYGHMNPSEAQFDGVDDNGEIWYNEPAVPGVREHEQYPMHPSYFSEQNRLALSRNHPDLYREPKIMQRMENDRRKRQWGEFADGYRPVAMMSRKRSQWSPAIYQRNVAPREDLYALSELLRGSPRNQEIPIYRRFAL